MLFKKNIFISIVMLAALFMGVNTWSSTNAQTNLDTMIKQTLLKTDPNKRANVYVTLYGSPDNDPPGTGNIAYPVIHQKAGGVGTYKDPVTYAVKKGYLPVGQIIYYPTLRKYFIMEDLCASCTRNQVDLWAGYGKRRSGILKCERTLTRPSAQIVISPASTLPVDTTPIWNEATKTCQKPYDM